MITDRDIEMRPDFSDEAASLLRGLLKRNVSLIILILSIHKLFHDVVFSHERD